MNMNEFIYFVVICLRLLQIHMLRQWFKECVQRVTHTTFVYSFSVLFQFYF